MQSAALASSLAAQRTSRRALRRLCSSVHISTPLLAMPRALALLRRLAPGGAAGASLASSSTHVLQLPSLAGGARALHASAPRLGFCSEMSDNDPLVLEREKLRNLEAPDTIPGRGGVPDVPGWNEALASDSEAVARARVRGRYARPRAPRIRAPGRGAARRAERIAPRALRSHAAPARRRPAHRRGRRVPPADAPARALAPLLPWCVPRSRRSARW